MAEEHVQLIYKIMSLQQWSIAQEAGVFKGAEVDLVDGYIHFSTATQVGETLSKHFAGQSNLVLLSVAVDSLGEDLRWEPSRGGQLFPHLYGELPCEKVVACNELELDKSGKHMLPDLA